MASKPLSLFASKTATFTGTAIKTVVPEGKQEVPVVIRGITTATVSVDGSLDGTNWVSLISKTADFAGTVPAFPFMRGRVTAYTSGTIFADIWADQRFG